MPLIAKPRLPFKLITLTNLAEALDHDESLTNILASRHDISRLKARAVNIVGSKLDRITAPEADLEKMGLTDVIFTHGDLTAANCSGASYRRTNLDNMRCSGLKLQMSMLRDVTFEDCKLDLANFRFSKLKNVLFKSCILDEADFYNAELENVSFQNCSLYKTEFSSAKCKMVDLRSSEITNILGIEGLAGTTIDSVQLVAISQTLAQSLKIHVSDE